ncbi:hypothetical protein VNO77_19316 [Canavalia gladiata]|uniref:Uncharacterized protein n=1 Tax=Canavalia gladiata TaxID=3824 RepID=A0AAN9QID8_CANGL
MSSPTIILRPTPASWATPLEAFVACYWGKGPPSPTRFTDLEFMQGISQFGIYGFEAGMALTTVDNLEQISFLYPGDHDETWSSIIVAIFKLDMSSFGVWIRKLYGNSHAGSKAASKVCPKGSRMSYLCKVVNRKDLFALPMESELSLPKRECNAERASRTGEDASLFSSTLFLNRMTCAVDFLFSRISPFS